MSWGGRHWIQRHKVKSCCDLRALSIGDKPITRIPLLTAKSVQKVVLTCEKKTDHLPGGSPNTRAGRDISVREKRGNCSQLSLPRHIFLHGCRCCCTVSTGIKVPHAPVRLPAFHNFWDRRPTACPMRRITTITEEQSPLLLLHGVWRANKAGEHKNSIREPLLRCRRLPIISQFYDVV